MFMWRFVWKKIRVYMAIILKLCYQSCFVIAVSLNFRVTLFLGMVKNREFRLKNYINLICIINNF